MKDSGVQSQVLDVKGDRVSTATGETVAGCLILSHRSDSNR